MKKKVVLYTMVLAIFSAGTSGCAFAISAASWKLQENAWKNRQVPAPWGPTSPASSTPQEGGVK